MSSPPILNVHDESDTPVELMTEDTALDSSASPAPPPAPIDDPLANGVKALFDPTIKQTTEKLALVHKSQLALSDELERLISRMLLLHRELTGSL